MSQAAKEQEVVTEQEAEEFIAQLEDTTEADQPLTLTPSPTKDPGQWSLFSSFHETTEWITGRLMDARSRWFGYQIQDHIKVLKMDKDLVLIQGVPYYTHTSTEHIFPYTNILAFEHPHKHKLNIYLPPKVGIEPPAGDVTLNNYDEVMALYTQDVSVLKLPVVIHVHGGGWQRGDRSIAFYGAPYMGAGYARSGFVSVSVSYRLATKTQQHPAQIEDVARAIRWVYDHCHQFGGDKTKIFISGHSAGAHLASLATVQPLFLKNLGLEEGIIKGAILISGIYDLNNAVSRTEVTCWQEALFQRAYVGPTFGRDPKIWLEASPYHLLSSNSLPPILLINATNDLGLEYGAQRFFKKLKDQGASVTAHVVPCTTHKTISQNSKTLELATDFIYQTLQSSEKL